MVSGYLLDGEDVGSLGRVEAEAARVVAGPQEVVVDADGPAAGLRAAARPAARVADCQKRLDHARHDVDDGHDEEGQEPQQ